MSKIRDFLKFSFNKESKFIDEFMFLCGTRGSRQRINKPIRVVYNIWVLTETYNYVVQFEPYQAVKKGKQIASSSKWGLLLILRLMECLPPTVSYHIFMNYFTSFRLLTHLGNSNIRATGVLN